MKRILLLAGEASGDLHGAILARALLARRPDLELWGVGGERMEQAGVRLLFRSEELAVVGLLEVARHAPRILAALETVNRFLSEQKPDLFVPIDYPDFNFRLLRPAYRLGVPIVYYISPQIWAWRGGRIHELRRFVRRMIVIFPFEEDLFRNGRVPVTWIGHPLVDCMEPAGTPQEERRVLHLPPGGPAVALLPGSRDSELRRMGPLLRATRAEVDRTRLREGRPPVQWLIGQAPGVSEAALRHVLEGPQGASADRGPTAAAAEGPGGGNPADGRARILSGADAMRAADLSLTASGTVTLEATLLGRPILVFYRMSRWTYALVRRLVRVDHIAMANLLAGRRLVPEFVQDAATPEALCRETVRLLNAPEELEAMRAGLLAARGRLGPPGAAERGAAAVLEVLEER